MLENHLLSSLPPTELALLAPHLKPVTLKLGETLYRPEEKAQYVYFPESSVISMLATMRNGSTMEVGLVGRQGLLGIRAFLGVEKTPHSAVVQISGKAKRMDAGSLMRVRQVGAPALVDLVLRYSHALLTQTRQAAACSAHHSINQRLARWLLLMADYTESDELEVTHELISLLIGSRRAGISVFAAKLQDAGLIDYRRGHMQVLNRAGLQEEACECYLIMRREMEKLYAPNEAA